MGAPGSEFKPSDGDVRKRDNARDPGRNRFPGIGLAGLAGWSMSGRMDEINRASRAMMVVAAQCDVRCHRSQGRRRALGSPWWSRAGSPPVRAETGRGRAAERPSGSGSIAGNRAVSGLQAFRFRGTNWRTKAISCCFNWCIGGEGDRRNTDFDGPRGLLYVLLTA